MVRTQIQITEAQAHALRDLAHRQGVSVAELIRQAIGRALQEQGDGEKWQRAAAIAGRFHSGRSDISEKHDEYLEDDHR